MSKLKKQRTEMVYGGLSHITSYPVANDEMEQQVFLFGTASDAAANIIIKDVGAFREAMIAMMSLVAFGINYKSADGDLVYNRKVQEPMTLAQSRNRYYSDIREEDPSAWLSMDPIVTITPTGILFEAVDQYGTTCAAFFLKAEGFEGEIKSGRLNIEVGIDLIEGLSTITTRQSLRLHIGHHPSTQEMSKTYVGSVTKSFVYPDEWERRVLQLLSSSQITKYDVKLSRIDLFNVLRHLRLHADVSDASKTMHFVLVNGRPVEMLMDPWDWKVTSVAGTHQGKSGIVGFYDRRSLLMLEPLLAYTQDISVGLVGTAQPSFWTFDCGSLIYTSGMQGFN